jgi:hypothetical protein
MQTRCVQHMISSFLLWFIVQKQILGNKDHTDLSSRTLLSSCRWWAAFAAEKPPASDGDGDSPDR